MELNFFAPLGMTQLVAPHMRARRSGMIVNVGSIGGKVTLPWMTLYSASKYALGRSPKACAWNCSATASSTMLVCPGYVKTGFQKNVRAGQTPGDGRASAPRAPSRRQQCARAIRRGVERDARTVVTPRAGWLLVVADAAVSRVWWKRRMAQMNGTA